MKLNFRFSDTNDNPPPTTDNNDDVMHAVPSIDNNAVSEGVNSLSKGVLKANNSPNIENEESSSSFAQNQNHQTCSGRRVMKPKRLLETTTLGLLSMHSDINIDGHANKPITLFQGQMACNETINNFPDDAINEMHPLIMAASQENNDVMHYHQAMKAEDVDSFRKAMRKEIKSFKDEEIFEILPMKEKPIHKSLISFFWSFKRKRNPVGELIKQKARLCAHGGKQIKGIDYWNTCAPVAQATTVRMMLMSQQMSG